MSLTSIEAAIGSLGRLGSSAPVVLGSVTLTGAEVPDQLVIGGKQQLVVQFLIGGGLQIQALGNDPGQLTLTGRFMGTNAQARAEAVSSLRRAGKAIAFSAAGLSIKCKIAEFRYTYTLKGAVCPYELILQRPPENSSSPTSTTSSVLSSLIGEDAANAISTAASTVTAVSTTIGSMASELGTVVGQVTPLATLIGAGSALGTISGDLSAVSGLSDAATNLSSAPSAVTAMGGSLYNSGSGLLKVLSSAGENLEGITLDNPAALASVTQNALIASTAVDMSSLVNRAAVNLGVASGTTVTRALL